MNKINQFSGKRILLVGATGILGRGYAAAIAKLDVQCVIADVPESDVLAYANELGIKGCEIDVSSEVSIVNCLKYVESELGGLDSVINNAAATSYKGIRYILYDKEFMQLINSRTNDWASLAILAHEVGHHINGHALDITMYAGGVVEAKSLANKRKQELEADQ